MATSYELLGRRSEDMATAQNYEETDGIDVTGAAFSINTRGNKSTDMTIMFNPKSEFAKKVDNIIERGLELSDLEATFIEARKYKRIGSSYEMGIPSAKRQKVAIVPSSFAPGNAELNSEITVKWIGTPVFGTFDPGDPTADYQWNFPDGEFEPETAPPAANQIHYKDGDASRSDVGIFFEFTSNTTF